MALALVNVAVYIDWQNVYNAARRAYGLTDAVSEEGQVSPYRVVIPRLRPLRYPPSYPNDPPEEKGIDVQLALAAVEHVIGTPPVCDVAIIFSHDTDLIPAVQTISRLKSAAHIETASWVSETYSARLRFPGIHVFHHELTRDIYEAVRDPVNYAHRG
jgi:hypothetical protein